MANQKSNNANSESNRSLNVVFVLDTTTSMKTYFAGTNVMILDKMNEVVENFLKQIMENTKFFEITKVAFITFSDGVTMDTDFYKVKDLKQECFKPLSDKYVQKVTMKKDVYVKIPGGKSDTIEVPVFEDIGKPTYSRVGAGVLHALNKLDKENQRMKKEFDAQGKSGERPYVPVMVLISDGAPNRTVDGKSCPTAFPPEEEEAKKQVREYCTSTGDATKLVIPVICAIGDEEVREQLEGYADYSSGYEAGFQYINPSNPGSGFEDLIVTLGQSLTRSISLAEEAKKKKDALESEGKKKDGVKQEKYRPYGPVMDQF